MSCCLVIPCNRLETCRREELHVIRRTAKHYWNIMTYEANHYLSVGVEGKCQSVRETALFHFLITEVRREHICQAVSEEELKRYGHVRVSEQRIIAVIGTWVFSRCHARFSSGRNFHGSCNPNVHFVLFC